MATIGTVRIGCVADTSGLSRGFARGAKDVQSFGSRIDAGFGRASASAGAAVSGLALAGLGAGVALAAGIGSAIKSGSDLKETLSKTGEVFGGSAGIITGEGQAMADAYGVAKTEFIGASTQFGQMFKGAGKGQAEAAGMGNQLAKLGMDLASFNNASNADAFTGLAAALRGEFDPLEKFGVFLSADAIKAEALRAGLAKNKNEVSEGAKKQATMNLIMKQTADAQGDLARTSGSAGNQMKQTWGRIANITADLGTAFLPITESVLGFVNGGLAQLSGWVSASGPAIGEWLNSAKAIALDVVFGTLVPGFQAVYASLALVPEGLNAAFGGDSVGALQGFGAMIWDNVIYFIDGIGFAWRNLPDLFDVGVLMITEKIINLGEWIGTIPANLGIIANYISGNWLNLIADGFNAFGTYVKNAATNLWNLGTAIIKFFQDPTGGFQFEWTPLLEGFQATAAALPAMIAPELTSMQGEIDAKLGVIGGREAQRTMEREAAAKAPIGAALVPGLAAKPGGPGAPDAMPEKEAEVKFAAAQQFGSAEAFSTLARFRAGGEGGDGIKDVAKTTKSQLEEQRAQTGLLRQIAGGGMGGTTPATAPGFA